MTCTVLVENSVQRSDLSAQHGLSFLIETGSSTILLDSGQNDLFARNAQVLCKRLSSVDFAVCSHAHYDHCGGFLTFCELNTSASIYTCWDGAMCYSSTHTATADAQRFIGWADTGKYAQRLLHVSAKIPTLLAEDVWLVPPVIHTASDPVKNQTLYTVVNGVQSHDDFSHECILAIALRSEERHGFVLFNSCSHNGVVNSIKSVQHFFPGNDILAYVGGFHFPWEFGETIAQRDCIAMNELAGYCAGTNTDLYTGHCTGSASFAYLDAVCHERLHHLYTGQSLSW